MSSCYFLLPCYNELAELRPYGIVLRYSSQPLGKQLDRLTCNEPSPVCKIRYGTLVPYAATDVQVGADFSSRDIPVFGDLHLMACYARWRELASGDNIGSWLRAPKKQRNPPSLRYGATFSLADAP